MRLSFGNIWALWPGRTTRRPRRSWPNSLAASGYSMRPCPKLLQQMRRPNAPTSSPSIAGSIVTSHHVDINKVLDTLISSPKVSLPTRRDEMTIVMHTDRDFTPSGKRSARAVQSLQGVRLHWYVSGRRYNSLAPTQGNLALTCEWLDAA